MIRLILLLIALCQNSENFKISCLEIKSHLIEGEPNVLQKVEQLDSLSELSHHAEDDHKRDYVNELEQDKYSKDKKCTYDLKYSEADKLDNPFPFHSAGNNNSKPLNDPVEKKFQDLGYEKLSTNATIKKLCNTLNNIKEENYKSFIMNNTGLMPKSPTLKSIQVKDNPQKNSLLNPASKIDSALKWNDPTVFVQLVDFNYTGPPEITADVNLSDKMEENKKIANATESFTLESGNILFTAPKYHLDPTPPYQKKNGNSKQQIKNNLQKVNSNPIFQVLTGAKIGPLDQPLLNNHTVKMIECPFLSGNAKDLALKGVTSEYNKNINTFKSGVVNIHKISSSANLKDFGLKEVTSEYNKNTNAFKSGVGSIHDLSINGNSKDFGLKEVTSEYNKNTNAFKSGVGSIHDLSINANSKDFGLKEVTSVYNKNTNAFKSGLENINKFSPLANLKTSFEGASVTNEQDFQSVQLRPAADFITSKVVTFGNFLEDSILAAQKPSSESTTMLLEMSTKNSTSELSTKSNWIFANMFGKINTHLINNVASNLRKSAQNDISNSTFKKQINVNGLLTLDKFNNPVVPNIHRNIVPSEDVKQGFIKGRKKNNQPMKQSDSLPQEEKSNEKSLKDMQIENTLLRRIINQISPMNFQKAKIRENLELEEQNNKLSTGNVKIARNEKISNSIWQQFASKFDIDTDLFSSPLLSIQNSAYYVKDKIENFDGTGAYKAFSNNILLSLNFVTAFLIIMLGIIGCKKSQLNTDDADDTDELDEESLNHKKSIKNLKRTSNTKNNSSNRLGTKENVRETAESKPLLGKKRSGANSKEHDYNIQVTEDSGVQFISYIPLRKKRGKTVSHPKIITEWFILEDIKPEKEEKSSIKEVEQVEQVERIALNNTGRKKSVYGLPSNLKAVDVSNPYLLAAAAKPKTNAQFGDRISLNPCAGEMTGSTTKLLSDIINSSKMSNKNQRSRI